jgi:hypothetical protein
MADMRDARRGAPKGPAPTIVTYTGASRSVQAQQNSATPPDPSGAVNAGYIVELINDAFSIYDKQTGNLVSRDDPAKFWASAGLPGVPVVDPRIVFIPDARPHGQWLAVQLELGRRVLMATTSPNDPLADPRLGKWKASAFAFPGNDFTMLGHDANGVYIGTIARSGQERVPEIAVMSRSKALAWPPQVGGPGDAKIIGPLSPEEYGYSLYPVIDQSREGTVGTAIGVDNVTKQHLTYSLISNGTIVYHDKIEVPAFNPVPKGYRVKQPYEIGHQSRIIFDDDGVVAAPWGTAPTSGWRTLFRAPLRLRTRRISAFAGTDSRSILLAAD